MTMEASEPRYEVMSGYLVEYTGEHTCGFGDYGVHEPHCGYEPVASIEQIEKWFSRNTTARYEEALRWLIGELDPELAGVLVHDEIDGKDHFPELARDFENRVNSDHV